MSDPRAQEPGDLDDGWAEFLRLVVPDKAAFARKVELRWAFYAGAASFYRAIMDPLFASDDVKPSDLARFREVDAELRDFCIEVHLSQSRSRATDYFGQARGVRARAYARAES